MKYERSSSPTAGSKHSPRTPIPAGLTRAEMHRVRKAGPGQGCLGDDLHVSRLLEAYNIDCYTQNCADAGLSR